MIFMKLLNVVRIIFIVLFVSLLLSCAGLKSKTVVQEEFDLGLSLFNRGKYEDALPHFVKATELDPEFGHAYLYIGKSYLNLGKWREAVPSLRTAYRLDPEETQKEITNILIDFFLQNLSKTDLDFEPQMDDLLKQK
jgi:tetratricopeptide (TPR) repeat protein